MRSKGIRAGIDRGIMKLVHDEHAWYKKIIPESVRRKVSNPLADMVIRGELEKKPTKYRPGVYPDGINLYGLLKAEIGLAQGAKLYAKAIEEGGIPHTLLNLSYCYDLAQNDRTFDDRLATENKYAINVAHINPPEWRMALGKFPQGQFNGHYNIGVWLWELEKIPADWVPIIRYVDEIWVPSRFIAEAVKKETDKPVTVIPYGIEVPYDEKVTRADFGLDEDDFLVLMMFDSRSYASRKNPGAAIDAFREAYGVNPEKVKLVIKINNPSEEDIAFVEEHMGGTDGYVLITERLEKEKLNSLIRLCDVFISLHRAEGFGLVMAEAMALGTPAVATNWSSNTEFMTEESACMAGYELVPVNGAYLGDDGTMMWAEANVAQAAGFLKRLKEDEEFYREKVEKGKEMIEERLSVGSCAKLIKERVGEILGSGQS